MDKRHLPFREIEPEEGNVVVSISYSGTGHAFLVCTAGSQPKVGVLFQRYPARGRRGPCSWEQLPLAHATTAVPASRAFSSPLF